MFSCADLKCELRVVVFSRLDEPRSFDRKKGQSMKWNEDGAVATVAGARALLSMMRRTFGSFLALVISKL